MELGTHRRARSRRGLVAVVAVVVLGAAVGVAAATGSDLGRFVHAGATPGRTPSAEDGVIPQGEGVSVFDEDVPAIAHLDPALRAAVQAAARDADADGVPMVVTSGWRSAAYQQQLLDDAVENYGSLEEARRWVSTPEESHHVTGRAVDIGYTDADSWLAQHGTDYGLCTTYANEMWHFELATTPGGECPPALEDAAG